MWSCGNVIRLVIWCKETLDYSVNNQDAPEPQQSPIFSSASRCNVEYSSSIQGIPKEIVRVGTPADVIVEY